MSLRAFLENQNPEGGPNLRSHNSVEDLIRATLGNNFVMSPVQYPIDRQIDLSIPNSEPVNEIVTEIPDVEKIIQQETNRIQNTQSRYNTPPLYKSISTPQIPGSPRLENPVTQDIIPDKRISQENQEGTSLPISQPVQKTEIPAKVQYDKKLKEYVLRRDVDETFECVVNIEGGSSSKPYSRIIMRTELWNLIFDGTIKSDGNCIVHLKKLHIFPEGTTGKISLEVVVDDVVFVPWERSFRISMSKKVSISKPLLK